MMSYRVTFEKNALKKLTKIDANQRIMLMAWIQKNLDQCENPRGHGKALSGKLDPYWSYRVGDYRIVVEIKDQELVIVIISLGHRRDVYHKI